MSDQERCQLDCCGHAGRGEEAGVYLCGISITVSVRRSLLRMSVTRRMTSCGCGPHLSNGIWIAKVRSVRGTTKLPPDSRS